jgi:hypothetical protein
MNNKDAQSALRIEIIHLEKEIQLKQRLLQDLRSTWTKTYAVGLIERRKESEPQVDDQTIADGLTPFLPGRVLQ